MGLWANCADETITGNVRCSPNRCDDVAPYDLTKGTIRRRATWTKSKGLIDEDEAARWGGLDVGIPTCVAPTLCRSRGRREQLNSRLRLDNLLILLLSEDQTSALIHTHLRQGGIRRGDTAILISITQQLTRRLRNTSAELQSMMN